MEGRSGGWIEVSGEDIIGKKLVDKSLLDGKTTIPYLLVKDFLYVLKKDSLEKGQGVTITILIDNKEFTAIFRHVGVNGKDNIYNIGFKKETTEYLKEKLYKSYKYIFEYNEDTNIEKPQEYIEFYKTDKLNTFRIELIVDDNYSFTELPNAEKNNLKEVSVAASEDNAALKEKFFDYIGNKEENLVNKYQKSYKLVLLIALLELADFEGKAVYDDICSYIKDFYIENHKKGLSVETSDSEIQRSIENLQVNTVRKVMNENPYNVISKEDYIFKEHVDDVEYLSFNTELWNEFTEEDKENLKDILNHKLNKYYLDKGLGENGELHSKKETVATVRNEETDTLETAISNKISRLEKNFESKAVEEYIYNYIAAEGYEYSRDIIKNLYLSLKTKPFVILYGISGTGKSKLVELFAKALGASREDETYNLIPVRPDWSDASELIGYRNIEGKFQPGILTNIIRKAAEHKEIPYFVCLDEMNLARVEYYFSDILSIMETRNNENGEIKTDKLIRRELFAGDKDAVKSFEDLYIPENLYIIGTVNMDETTFPFSKKVLDRANTIEFNEVNLDYDFDREKAQIQPKIYPNRLLLSEYIKISECSKRKDTAKAVIDELVEINKILKECDMQFAYRVRDEIVFYVIYAVYEEIMDFNHALDYEIKQKILPRIGGSGEEIEKCLFKLFLHCSQMKKGNLDSDYIDENTLEELTQYLEKVKKSLKKDYDGEKISCKYPISSEKILKMLRRFNRDGFTTFW
ncbi:McrB family protein [Clostridium coskatii]|uniref:5-methylcytosine-specific restriction enzyme B n=1 Tax=Clostridium coskatii TaxID=1705578 RepID=A0A166U3R6_9CLOT|nr:AAA family ATPase [Clostridium coskatii]OAA94533.1 5-methylcytosine-specific restriction enzyme B [Clostridium coskatii]OBR93277.1 5-methylcytosine-specific restriction enzyme B [Clostridium coskatii]